MPKKRHQPVKPWHFRTRLVESFNAGYRLFDEEPLEYRDYLRRDEWRAFVRQTHAVFGDKCYICGLRTDLHVHHISYPPLPFTERLHADLALSDLVLVCATHHQQIHMVVDNGAASRSEAELRAMQIFLLTEGLYRRPSP